jgi:hypothetical protein
MWFDYEPGEKEFYKGFLCDEHKVSDRVEKLALQGNGKGTPGLYILACLYHYVFSSLNFRSGIAGKEIALNFPVSSFCLINLLVDDWQSGWFLIISRFCQDPRTQLLFE